MLWWRLAILKIFNVHCKNKQYKPENGAQVVYWQKKKKVLQTESRKLKWNLCCQTAIGSINMDAWLLKDKQIHV